MQEGNPEAVFAARMRQAREAAGMTQPELADRLHQESGIKLDATAITRMERGNRMIRLNEAVNLSAILNIRLLDLVTMPAWTAGYSPEDMTAHARALAAEIAQIDARAAKADADMVQLELRKADLEKRRDDLQVALARLHALPSPDGGQ